MSTTATHRYSICTQPHLTYLTFAEEAFLLLALCCKENNNLFPDWACRQSTVRPHLRAWPALSYGASLPATALPHHGAHCCLPQRGWDHSLLHRPSLPLCQSSTRDAITSPGKFLFMYVYFYVKASSGSFVPKTKWCFFFCDTIKLSWLSKTLWLKSLSLS